MGSNSPNADSTLILPLRRRIVTAANGGHTRIVLKYALITQNVLTQSMCVFEFKTTNILLEWYYIFIKITELFIQILIYGTVITG